MNKYGEVNRKIKTAVPRYLDGDTASLQTVLRLAKDREDYLKTKKHDPRTSRKPHGKSL